MMNIKSLYLFLSALLLSSCISVSVDSSGLGTSTPVFVTAALAPTQPGFEPSIPTPTVTPDVESTIPAALSTESAPCKDIAILLEDVTIPDNTRVPAGQSFTKTWRFKNAGSCKWTGYSVAFASGDEMNAPPKQIIPETEAGAQADISVTLTAPSADGIYTGYFTLNDADGQSVSIGTEKTFWVKIVVGDPATLQATSVSTEKTPYKPGGGNSNCASTSNGAYIQELLGLINQARVNAGVRELTVNFQLKEAAQKHSADMACNNFLGHTGSDGSWIGDRLAKFGYNSFYYAEIIAIGTPQNAISQWAADKPHWDSVIDASVTEIGIGYAYYDKSDFGGYWTVELGAR